MTKPLGASAENVRDEIDCLTAKVEILEAVLLMKSFGKVLSGTELVEQPDGGAIVTFDKGAQA